MFFMYLGPAAPAIRTKPAIEEHRSGIVFIDFALGDKG